ncbi:LysR family transcriptional regulator [Thalassotalea sp. PLHSN55]|uniref:LysR family transcriptional regulator n=1 Tax=Thalassotalea sp. PLHSN55 TaxID=3435888 RepID=UPI003F8374C1
MASNTKLFDGVVIFTEVVKCGGFSAAAEATGHSTSYISKEVNKLEARLGVRLLNRTTRSISLTPEGKVYYQQCLQMVADAEQTLGELDQQDIAPKGLLKISCPVALSHNYLQPILSEFMQTYPNVQLEIDLNDRHVDVVQDGFDLVIRATHQLEESSLICRKLFSSKAYVVATKQYIKRFGRPTTPDELVDHACICYSNLKNPTRWYFTDASGKYSYVDVKSRLLCNSSEMELALTLDSIGICRLPAFTMEKELANNQLEILLNDYPAQNIDVFAIYPSRKHLAPKVRSFIDLLVKRVNG